MINFHKKNMSLSKKRRRGFALLYALLLTGAVLSVGVILMNIITKQLVFSSISRNSEVSYYYLANSGRECLRYNNNKFYTVSRDPDTGSREFSFNIDSLSFECFEQDVNLAIDNTAPSDYPKLTWRGEVDGKEVELSAQFNRGCLTRVPGSCNQQDDGLIGVNKAVFRASGSEGSGLRQTLRSATYVQKVGS
jgi:hypothetical protein